MAVKTYFSVAGRSKQMRKGSKVSVDGYSRKLHKLYASVNGTSKLIFDDGDMQPYDTIVYYEDDPAAPYKTAVVASDTLEVRVSWYGGTPIIQQVTVDGNYLPARWLRGVRIGSRVTNLDNFLSNLRANEVPGVSMPVYIPDNVTTVGAGLCFESSSFNQPVFVGKGVKNIVHGFLRNCTNFNQPVVFSEGIETMGALFFLNCRVFNQDLKIPQTITNIGGDSGGSGMTYYGAFLRNCYNYTSTVDFGNLPPTIFKPEIRSDCFVMDRNNVPAYTTGITIKVSPAQLNYWQTAFPDLSGSAYYRHINWITG